MDGATYDSPMDEIHVNTVRTVLRFPVKASEYNVLRTSLFRCSHQCIKCATSQQHSFTFAVISHDRKLLDPQIPISRVWGEVCVEKPELYGELINQAKHLTVAKDLKVW